MDLEEEVRSLTNQEKRILSALGELDGKAKVQEIQEQSGLSQSGIMRGALNLEENEFLKIEKITLEQVFITEEGRNYLENSLPERRVLKALSEEEKIELNKLSEKTNIPQDKSGIAIGWIKKKDWGEIEEKDGEKILKITEEGREAVGTKDDEEKLLEKFENVESLLVESISEELREEISTLKRRDLVELKEKNQHKLVLSEKGEEAQNYDLELQEKVSKLNRDLIKSGDWREVELRDYNVTASTEPFYPGKEHPQRKIIEELRSILLRMGFEEIRGPMVESEFWNFDALFQAQNHPAREIHDTLSLSKPERAEIPDEDLIQKVKKAHEEGVAGSEGWGYDFDEEISHRPILRSQTTADTVRYLAQKPEPPVKVFCIDKVFRRERIDYQHLAEFPQAEGIVMAEDLNLRNMLGYLKEILLEIGVPKIRFRPGYFPYTEPSAEADGYFPERDEWIELLGAGMFRPELLEPLGIDYPVLAWGIGFSRIAMIRMGIEDMRDLHNNDLEWLRNSPLG